MRQKQPNGIISHLALLSVKHNVSVVDLFQALGSAKERKKARCQGLAIEYRGSIKQEAIFLITKESRVVGQFRVAEEFLRRKDIRFENWMNTEEIRKAIDKKKMEGKHFTLVQDMRHGMKRVNLEAEVLETSTPAHVFSQYGNGSTITHALIGDKTGTIKLCLWNEQANAISAGDKVLINNATVSTYKGERQLRLGKTGSVSVLHQKK